MRSAALSVLAIWFAGTCKVRDSSSISCAMRVKFSSAVAEEGPLPMAFCAMVVNAEAASPSMG